ncbi:Mitochondrial acidic protein mam33 [Tulasnella sp. 418]|nr:Mitochondrial acidic protein mam33 [Tulasnella sp. 418]
MASMRSLRTAASALRTFSTPVRSSVLRSAPLSRTTLATRQSLARQFSVSARSFGQGESDVELVSKLKEEIQYEKEAAAEAGPVPEFVSDFKSSGVWSIEAKDGNDEVVLTRKFGNEEVRVIFSIADIDAEAPAPEFDEDGNPVEGENSLTSTPVRCAITMTKPNTGALTVDCVAQDGNFTIDNITFYGDGSLAKELTAEADWKRRGLYIGPQFDHLDVALQESFERYLEERGINSSLALFIPEYAEYKEQQEYSKWLDNVHSFVSA